MIALENSLQALVSSLPPFEPTPWFDQEMDMLVYLREDCSFRADRVDPFLTLLWHPHRDEVVGLKLKGIRSQFENIVDALGDDTDFIPLVEVIGGIMLLSMNSDAMSDFADGRRDERKRKYLEAKCVAYGAKIPRNLDEIALAA